MTDNHSPKQSPLTSAINQGTNEVSSASMPVPSFNLDDPNYYLNRELTWLAFNIRVLAEAKNPANPLLERVKFLAIVNNNLDEFFMKRIGGLKQQVGAGVTETAPDGRTPSQQINECYDVISDLNVDMARLWDALQVELARERIKIERVEDLAASDQQVLRGYFSRNIYPLITPQAVDPAHPFPFVSNLSLNLLVTLADTDGRAGALARVKVPVGQGSRRFVRIPNQDDDRFVALEDLIINNIDMLFPNVDIDSVETFRVTRNAVTEKDEEKAEDLLEMIESELRERRLASIVRLEVSENMSEEHRLLLASELELDKVKDVFAKEGLLGLKDLFEIAGVKRPELHDAHISPADHTAFMSGSDRNIFREIRERGPFLLQHPYESFVTSVERFVRDASRDPDVVGIKMTIYRTSDDSKIIDYLIDASQNGKQVTVVVELKARFDESANIRWANHLEEAGIHVTYGVVGLKTHCKLIYVLRKDDDGLRRYAHIGTGNYHSGTARLYSDLGLLTCDEKIGSDLTELFNYLTTGYTPQRDYQKLLPAPKHMKKGLLAKIEREADHARDGKKALIQLKTNALEDVDIAKALYQASMAGVTINLLVRDTCRVRPGIAGLSDNITVVSIVGRFLEHARIYYFHNDGNEEYYIGSADLMRRNLESRVEVITPVEAFELRAQLRTFLDTQLSDHKNAWEMQSDGSYVKRHSDVDSLPAQLQFVEQAHYRQREAVRLRRRKIRYLS